MKRLCLFLAIIFFCASYSFAVQELKQSTQVKVRMGPFVDITDGLTPETGITLGSTDEAEALKYNGATTVDISGETMAAITGCDGWYDLTLTTSITDTLGDLGIIIQDDSECLPVFAVFSVVTANYWDSKYGTDTRHVDVIEMSGEVQSITDLKDFADAGYDPVNDRIVKVYQLTELDEDNTTLDLDGTEIQANATKISGDSTSADNLELQYDTTGLAGDTFPATQAQLAGITNVGAAVSTTASSYTLTTGTQSSGTYASTAALDGTNHEHTSAAGVMDLYYEFTIGAGIPTSVIITGYLNGNNDDLEIHGYDWVGTAWVQIGTLAGKAATTNEVDAYELTTNMVGSGANEGTVRVRLTDGAFTLTTATLAIDQVLLSFSRGSEGYDNGAVWLDTTASNTNTVVGIDGTARNPVSTIAAANTLIASTNLNRIEVAPGSSVTFAASQDNQIFTGHNWTLALGGQSVSASFIYGASVSGICTGASPPIFDECILNAITVPPCEMRCCDFASTITAGSAGDFYLNGCCSRVAGAGTPIFDFGSGLAASNLNMRDYSGGIDIRYMGQGAGTYNMSLEGDGQLVVNANCSATSNISIRGNFKVTNNASGMTIAYDDDTTDINAILADTGTEGVVLNWADISGPTATINLSGTTIKTATDVETKLKRLRP